ncbi:hypothetical protein [Salinivibrio proteolyticus]|uniref:Uncharacterized protein n=1 Tax=Salinivibrio proteolyticus TaxID=334715 RepID=A0ABY7LGR0_9GAMM|nr:hypothetical protein [Salinivibrio proteolyticus]WBA16386.1 hypothetical protein N7E60_16765 [Salinivibrio proteolyticus]
MDSEKEHLDDITAENSFWCLYKVIRNMKDSSDNMLVFFATFLIMLFLNSSSTTTTEMLLNEIQLVSTNIINWSVSIVGFILAGYSIYSTLSDKELQYSMSRFIDDRYNISYLKSSHCVFIKVIIDIISLSLLTYLYSSFMRTDIPKGISNVYLFEVSIYKIYLCFTLSLLQSFFVLILMMCKSFIYNVYHSIMTSIRWYGENKVDSEERE